MSKQFTQEEYDYVVKIVQAAKNPLDQVAVALRALFNVLQAADPRPDIPYDRFVKDALFDVLSGIMKQVAEVMHESICPGCKAGKGCGSNTVH